MFKCSGHYSAAPPLYLDPGIKTMSFLQFRPTCWLSVCQAAVLSCTACEASTLCGRNMKSNAFSWSHMEYFVFTVANDDYKYA